VKVRVGQGYHFTYDPNTYPCRWVCPRSAEFNKHYYESVGELGAETASGSAPEEFQFAQWLDSRAEVEWWVRNLDRQPNHAFWLQTSTDKFYPDFVAKLKDGRILVAEYKGEHLATNDDSVEKERLGDLWAEHSGGAGLFVLVKGLGDRERVEKLMQGEK
jgi:type III restriction enzyme